MFLSCLQRPQRPRNFIAERNLFESVILSHFLKILAAILKLQLPTQIDIIFVLFVFSFFPHHSLLIVAYFNSYSTPHNSVCIPIDCCVICVAYDKASLAPELPFRGMLNWFVPSSIDLCSASVVFVTAMAAESMLMTPLLVWDMWPSVWSDSSSKWQ